MELLELDVPVINLEQANLLIQVDNIVIDQDLVNLSFNSVIRLVSFFVIIPFAIKDS